jgi:predicted flap endonuclease-1-like 5' DNA nuclease
MPNSDYWHPQAQMMARGIAQLARTPSVAAGSAIWLAGRNAAVCETLARDMIDGYARTLRAVRVLGALSRVGGSGPATPARAAPAPRPKPSAAAAAPRTDDLTAIKGVGPRLAEELSGLGVVRFEQIAAWTAPEAARVSGQLSPSARRFARPESWIEQARALAGA